MHNFNASVRITVCFQDSAESQINMAKVYFYGEMTMLKKMLKRKKVTYLIQCMLPTPYCDMLCF